MNFFNRLTATLTGVVAMWLAVYLKVIIEFPLTMILAVRELRFTTFFEKVFNGLIATMLLLLAVVMPIVSVGFVVMMLLNPVAMLVNMSTLLFVELFNKCLSPWRRSSFDLVLASWNNGFIGVFDECADIYNRVVFLYRAVLDRAVLLDAPGALGAPVYVAAPLAVNAVVNLTENEFAMLQTSQQPQLTADEIRQLKAYADTTITAKVDNYESLLSRLESGECPVLWERPAKENTLLVVKQYQRDGQWECVPGSSYVFDKNAWARSIALNLYQPKHPMTNDRVDQPSYYNNYPTRYVTHRYYANASSTSGISQELSDKAAELRTLRPAPVSAPQATGSSFSRWFSLWPVAGTNDQADAHHSPSVAAP